MRDNSNIRSLILRSDDKGFCGVPLKYAMQAADLTEVCAYNRTGRCGQSRFCHRFCEEMKQTASLLE